ncbi:hypothetical protein [Desulfovibrio litoralis]|uniref:Lipoprotein n=1 Tax=Desulfovibrio litoralis DSM 11393 TaxID=1121455 RepID=A0A1M7STX7_9BACT|nr:hypothetical protein [Desulfovibrio litoralis]SHN61826.1 hypothetical protein SAMN02745728_01268 [Desulfovibrio litoralis DSM 11393]
MNLSKSTFTLLSVLILLTIMLTTGCRRNAPVMNFTDSSVATLSDNKSLEKVGKAIVAGASGLGWQTSKTTPGVITATLYIRNHVAVVEIPYTAHSFSIVYKSSTNLQYKDGTIHPQYNNWVRNLHNAIMSEMARI